MMQIMQGSKGDDGGDQGIKSTEVKKKTDIKQQDQNVSSDISEVQGDSKLYAPQYRLPRGKRHQEMAATSPTSNGLFSQLKG
jgi:hypothetical protein